MFTRIVKQAGVGRNERPRRRNKVGKYGRAQLTGKSRNYKRDAFVHNVVSRNPPNPNVQENRGMVPGRLAPGRNPGE
jgi:hypothetical protein